MRIEVRDATAADAAAVVAMWHRLTEDEGGEASGFTEAIFLRDGIGPEAAFSCLIAEAAEVGGGRRLAGYLTMLPHYDSDALVRGSHVCDLYTERGYRRQGVARALLGEAARRTAARGGVFLTWNVLAKNQRAIAAYRRLGRVWDNLLICSAEGGKFAALLKA
ncbi:MAG: GNAT family N-acetyltransferase [Rhodovibrionaceae bacterium]